MDEEKAKTLEELVERIRKLLQDADLQDINLEEALDTADED